MSINNPTAAHDPLLEMLKVHWAELDEEGRDLMTRFIRVLPKLRDPVSARLRQKLKPMGLKQVVPILEARAQRISDLRSRMKKIARQVSA